MKKAKDISELHIELLNDEDITFTEQLEEIIRAINEGYTAGQGWYLKRKKA